VKKLFFSTVLTFLIFCNGFAQSFDSERLPIGDTNKKYNFCAAKLDEIFNTNTNCETSFAEMINDLKQKRIVMIGESHTNQLHHDVQYEVIKGLVESGRPVVLALEMFNPSQNEALAYWSSGQTDPNTFLEQTDFLTSWSHNYRYYKQIFDYCREKHIPIYGANVERKYASKINMGGLSSLTEEDIQILPHIDTSNVEHKFLINVMMGGMDASMPQQFDNMYAAQCLWDAAMGEGAIEAAKNHPEATVVLLAGSGHVVYNLGIGRIIKDKSNFPFTSVVTVDIPEKTQQSDMVKVKKELEKEKNKDAKTTTTSPHSMGMMTADDTPFKIVIRTYADYLFGKSEMKQEKYPSFGFSLLASENQEYLIDRVLPQTIAYENGLQKGDLIQSVDGKSFDNLFELKKYLHFKNWDEEISFNIQRDNEYKEITFVLRPIKSNDD
jgi:uncharacterized iron-regulated protein